LRGEVQDEGASKQVPPHLCPLPFGEKVRMRGKFSHPEGCGYKIPLFVSQLEYLEQIKANNELMIHK